jgi:hypothetical protein
MVPAVLVPLVLLRLGQQQAAAVGSVLLPAVRPLELQQLVVLGLQATCQRLVQEPAAAAAALGQQAVLPPLAPQQAALLLLAHQAVVQRSEQVLAAVLDLALVQVPLLLGAALVLLAVPQHLVRQRVLLLGLVLLRARQVLEQQRVVLLVPARLRLVRRQAAQEALGHQQGQQVALALQAMPQVVLERRPPLAVGSAAHLRLELHPLALLPQPLALQQAVLVALALQVLLPRLVLVVGLVVHLLPVLAVAVASVWGSKMHRVGGARSLQGAAAPRVDE